MPMLFLAHSLRAWTLGAGVLLLLSFPASAQEQELREAARLDALQQCDQAELHYQRIISQPQPSAAALNNIGNHYLICGDPAKARVWFGRLLAISPAHANANLQMARLEMAGKRGDAALLYLSRVHETGPAITILRAEAMYWAGRKTEASGLLRALEKDAASDVRVLFALGETYERIGQHDQAEAAYTGVLAQRPNDPEVLYRVGRAAARAQHLDRAQKTLEVASKLQPEDVDTLLELGRVHAAHQDSSRAVYLLAQARQRAPQRPDVLLALARAAEDAGFYGDSALAFQEYLRLRPDDEAARRDRALMLGLTPSGSAEGTRELERYVQTHPSDAAAWFGLARLCWVANPQKALDHLSMALRLEPSNAAARYARAWLLYRAGRLEESLTDLRATLAAAPENVRVLAQLGLTHLALDQPSEAEKVLTRALRLAPNDPDVLLHLGRALMSLNRTDEAQQYLEKFQKVRPQIVRGARTEAGMIELATLPPAERVQREIERLRRESRAHPGDAVLQQHLASLLVTSGQVDEGIREFRGLLSGNPDPAIAREAGLFLLSARQYAMARDFLEPAAAAWPAVRIDLAFATFAIAGPSEALRVLGRVAPEDRSGDYFLLRARLLDAAGQDAEAAKVLQQGLKQISSHSQIVYQAAALLVKQGQPEDALALLGRVPGSLAADPDLLAMRAALLGMLDRSREAETTLRDIERRWPEWDRPYLIHAMILEKAGKRAGVKQKAETALALGSRNPAAACLLGRTVTASAQAACACAATLQALISPPCEGSR